MVEFRQREVARRVFARELNEATHRVGGGEDRTPVYVLTPLGLRCNRVFVVAALLEKEEVRPDSGIWRIRLADPTGVFIGYIGRFQPEALESLMDIEPPTLVSVTAKVRLFEGETRNFVSLRPEFVNRAEFEERDYWIVETATQTIERIKEFKRCLAGEDVGEDVKLAMEVYGTRVDDYIEMLESILKQLVEEYKETKEEEEREEAEEMVEEIGEEIEEEEVPEVPEEDFEDLEFEEEEWDLSDLLEDEE